MGGVIEIYYITTEGGDLPDLLQYYKGEGGSLGTPNLYYVIYGRPLKTRKDTCTNPNWRIFRMSEDRICHWWDKKESAIHVYGAMKEEKARTDELDAKSNQLQARVDERGIC